MNWLPELKIGLFNAWLPLVVFYIFFGFYLLLQPKEIIKKLYQVSPSKWPSNWRKLYFGGRIFTLLTLGLLIFSKLKIGQPVFYVGLLVYLLGFVVIFTALFNYASTPVNEPVVKGLYRRSRNPQFLGLALIFLGACIACGSILLVLLFAAAMSTYHFRILGEEDQCLKSYGDSYKAYLNKTKRYI